MTSRAQIIAKSIAASLQSEISQSSQASLIVCGGSRPIVIFSYLNLQDFDYEQWQQIVLTFNPDQMRNR